jgi:hypothetical protein
MDFGNAFEVKRHLTLQLVFSQIGEALRLEMQYQIIPMVNIGQSEKLLQKARDSIGKALTAGQELYQVGIIPANKEVQAEAERERQGNDRLLQGIEVVLLLNVVLVLIFSMTTKSLQSAMSIVLMLQVLWIPIGFCFAMFASPKNGGGSSWGLGKTILITIGGAAVCIVACPIILFGLCTGAVLVNSVQR